MMAAPTPAAPLDTGSTTDIVDMASHGGRLATIFSALALLFSGFSFYKSVLEAAELGVFIPPVIHYGRDGGGDIELFAIPITIANEGARTGTVVSMELEVASLDGTARQKRYYAAYVGEHPRNPDTSNRAFAPLSIAGRATFSETIRFYPAGNPLPKLVEEAGDFRFTLKLNTAVPAKPDLFDRLWRSEPRPVSFDLTIPFVSDQHLGFRRGSVAMHQKDWKTTAGAAK
jgi:hypothetical protein